MEYIQERVTTLHDFGGASPTAPVGRASVVIPLTAADYESPASSAVFETVADVDPERVIVPLRAPRDRVLEVIAWIESFDLPVTVLWCNAPAVASLVAAYGIDANAGKGLDVWLALGLASDSEYVVVHDADAETYDETQIPRLLHPLANGHTFSKGYYARVEEDGLYGRLCRLFVTPLVRVLEADNRAPMLSYLSAFRYPLAGEFAVTGEMARSLRPPGGWGLEIATLCDAYDHAGFARSAQVDLGIHRHEHRPVDGDGGLGTMAREVGATLVARLESAGVDIDYDTLVDRYQDCASDLVAQYSLDAAFNDVPFDAESEQAQVETYAAAIAAPDEQPWLPAWRETPLDPTAVENRSADALAGLRTTI